MERDLSTPLADFAADPLGRHALSIALLLGCSSSERAVDERVPAPAADEAPRAAGEIVVLRTGCYGPCPEDLTVIATDGRIHYSGGSSTERTGLHTARVDASAVDAVLELARAGGYFETDAHYEAHVTDRATVASSIALGGRRHSVRNYGAAAPTAVSAVEDAALALLGAARWDERAEWVGRVDACKTLGRAILGRCVDALSLKSTGGECGHWLGVWDLLGDPGLGDDDRIALCSRQLESVELTRASAAAPAPATLPGPECAKWAERTSRPCRAALEQGVPERDHCGRALQGAVRRVEILDAADVAPADRLTLAEALCGRGH